MLSDIGDFFEYYLRNFIVWLTNFLPVKVIRDDKGVPFLYRYHLFTLGYDGPGLCIHRFVKSDPERGYHDHPWSSALSFILVGGYEERILNNDRVTYKTYQRNRWTFNYLDGEKSFHRVMIKEGKDAWTLFAFKKRSKVWGMINLQGEYYPMSKTVEDNDGGWWNSVEKGYSINNHIEHKGKVIATVDVIVLYQPESQNHNFENNQNETCTQVLLIKRGKEPYKDCWAFPGGRIEQKDESIIEAARRELKEETNLDLYNLEFLKCIGNNKRDPRGFCLTNVFLVKLSYFPMKVKAGDDAVDYEWFPLDHLPSMAFDHKEILKECILNSSNKVS